MKWGKKKSPTNSSLLARVFSGSWFSKLKPSGNHRNETDSFKGRQGSEVGYGYQTKFYSLEEADLDWMVPVVDKRVQGRRSTGGINPLWCESGYKFRSLGFEEPEIHRRDEFLSFSDVVLDVKNRQSGKKNKGAVSENVSCSRNVSDRSSCILSPVNDDDHFLQLGSISDRSCDFEDKGIREMKVKKRAESSSKKKSSKSKQKVNSPRTQRRNRGGSNDQVRKTRMEEEDEDEETVFDSFAMVKSSSNPQNDFRDSMIEMIRERDLHHPKELEQLLSCYLMLNSDEYHDLIIQVFRQVWSEMNTEQFHN